MSKYNNHIASTRPLQASSVGNPYGFTGREFDSETGLYYYRARYYNSKLGRFLQTDPIGYYDSMNLYQYCGNNGVNWVDPWGLQGLVPYYALPPTANWLFDKYMEKERVRESEEGGKCKKVIIGEDMKRILAYMAAHPNEKFEAFLWDDIWPFSWIPTPVLLEFNEKWIKQKMKEHREIIDIGRSPKRRTEGDPISPFYGMEEFKTRNYYNRHSVNPGY